MGRGFDAPFPYLSEGSIIDLRNLWDYVGRHGANDIHPLPHICGETLLQNFRKK